MKRKRILLISAYCIYCTAGLLAAAFSPFGVLVAPLIALVPVSTWIISYFTWRYVKPEYLYTTVSGRLTFTVVYGGKSRKKQFEIRIAEAEAIEPYTGDSAKSVERYSPEKIYSGVSERNSPDAYYMLFRGEDGKRSVFYFEATAKMLKILKYYNSSTIVGKVRY